MKKSGGKNTGQAKQQGDDSCSDSDSSDSGSTDHPKGEELVAACRSGKEDAVNEFLAAGWDVNALCSSRAAGFCAPAIWWASESGQAKVVRALLLRGASTEARSLVYLIAAMHRVHKEALLVRKSLAHYLCLSRLFLRRLTSASPPPPCIELRTEGTTQRWTCSSLRGRERQRARCPDRETRLFTSLVSRNRISGDIFERIMSLTARPALSCSESGQGGLRYQAFECWSKFLCAKSARRDAALPHERSSDHQVAAGESPVSTASRLRLDCVRGCKAST